MKHNFTVTTAAIVIAGSLLGAGSVAAVATAQTNTTAHRSKSSKQHQQRIDERLNQAVRDGTITTGQKTAFKTELKTLREQHKTDLKATKPVTAADRASERSKLASELQTWANANNFPLAKIAPQFAKN